ncbi:MAG: hypothetical protein Q8N60_05130 [Candidatus Diapherotrites archaeon]|nr:hypothetical protein [Candidatus Diapherotrites archaeon]
MKKSIYALALFLLLFSAGCQALILTETGTIVVQQDERNVDVKIRNDSDSAQDFTIELSIPNASIDPSEGSLDAGESVTALLSISPEENLAGSTYYGQLRVMIGEEQERKEIRVMFKGEEAEEPKEEPKPNPSGFFALPNLSALFTAENALNVVLALVAAILLIAFIARLVKRLEAK